MKLIPHELDLNGTPELVQEVTALKNTSLYAIRPHIYRHNFPTGSLKIEVLDSEDNLVAESESVDIEDISPGDNFFHGYVRFLISGGLSEGETYKIKLIGEDGYAYSGSSFIGWCNDFDLARYDVDYSPPSSLNRPLDLEIWERKAK